MRLIHTVCFVIVASMASSAWAAATDFSAGSWVIPMDICYQPSQSFDGSSFSGTDESSTFYTTGCPDTSSATHKDGVLKAYGLIYRFLQHSIPVYYILNPNKTAANDTDFSITNLAGTPVARLSHSTWTNIEFMNAAHTSIDYRGSPFIISAADVPAALALMQSNSDFTFTDSRTGRVVFRDVHIHVAKVNILQAPVRAILKQVPPKIALMDIGGAAIGVLEGYLKDSGLYNATAYGFYPTIGDVFTAFDNVSDFTTSNGLVAGGFKILWAPHWNGANNTATDRDAIVAKISAFVDAGNPFFAQCAALATMEGQSASDGSNTNASTNGHFQVNATGTNHGLTGNQLNQNDFPHTTGDKIVVNPDATIKAWLNPLSQTGDYPLWVNVGSFTFDFAPASGYAYRSFTQSLIQSVSSTSGLSGLQIETVANKDGDPAKGQIIYLGGHSYGSQGSSCGAGCSTFPQWNTIGMERLILNTLIFLGQEPSNIERTRSAPIVFRDGKTYLGSYVQKSQAQAAYPPWDGHFREYPANALNGANNTQFNQITPNWDAATKIATQAAADARVIFTAVPVSGKLTKVAFTTGNLATLQTTVPSLTAATITSIRKGGLGGIDHSIPAIIEPSQVAGSSTRPTVAYMGALDGMLHAILVSGTVSGKNPGDELWAFIPPSQLAKTVAQSGGVDGSPSVGDAFIDPTGANGTKSWRTVLGITDGTYAGGTIDVLDITDPTNPSFLWEASDSVTISSKTYVMGRAQGAAISPVMTGSGLTFAFFFATDNTNGNGGNGFNLYALDASNGNVIWRVNKTYVNDTSHNDVPGTAAVIDAAGDAGPATKVYFGDVEGKVWAIDAATGSNATAIYDAASANSAANSINYPIESAIVLYRDPSNSHLSVLGVTGGADWVPAATLSRVFRVDTNSPYTASNLLTLASGERVYAVPTIYGNAAYLITSQGNLQGATGTDFNANGSILRVNLGATAGVTTLGTVKQGASEVAVDASGNVIAASISGLTQSGNTGRDTSQATISLQNQAATKLTVRAWLDLH